MSTRAAPSVISHGYNLEDLEEGEILNRMLVCTRQICEICVKMEKKRWNEN